MIFKKYMRFSASLLSFFLLFSFLQKSLFLEAMTEAQAKAVFTVVIDAGHGGVDDGAIGVNGVSEKALNLAFAELLAAYFREAGAEVILTRTEDDLVLQPGDENAPSRKQKDLENRLAIASQYPDALFISVHMNSFPAAQYRGFECYYSENHPHSILYAQAIRTAVVEKHEPYNKRNVKKGKDIYLLKHASSPAILLECGFLSNAEDAQKLSDKDYQKQLSFSIFCAIMEEKEKLSS